MPSAPIAAPTPVYQDAKKGIVSLPELAYK
jgi:hypothetical protein